MSLDNSTIQGIGEGINSVLGGINPIYGNILAGIKNADAQKKKEQLIADYGANAEARYNTLANQDFLDTNVASSIMTRIKENLKNANNMADKQAATTGATNEATLAAKTANQKQYNDVVSQVAGMGTARADQIEARHQNQEGQILGLNVGLANDDIAAAQTQAANANETMNSMMSGISTLAGVPSVGASVKLPGTSEAMDNSVQVGQTGPSLVAPSNPYSYTPYDIYNPLQYLNP